MMGDCEMKKILFFFCNLMSIIGLCILFFTSLLNKIFPMLGRVAFQAAMAGSYSPSDYKINFTVINLCATLMIVVGVIVSYLLYKKGYILK